jgi:hypothetical protein
MYTQPITSAPSSTEYVNPLRAAKSPACRTRSARFCSADISVGHFASGKPGVARMWAMLDIQAS